MTMVLTHGNEVSTGLAAVGIKPKTDGRAAALVADAVNRWISIDAPNGDKVDVEKLSKWLRGWGSALAELEHDGDFEALVDEALEFCDDQPGTELIDTFSDWRAIAVDVLSETGNFDLISGAIVRRGLEWAVQSFSDELSPGDITRCISAISKTITAGTEDEVGRDERIADAVDVLTSVRNEIAGKGGDRDDPGFARMTAAHAYRSLVVDIIDEQLHLLERTAPAATMRIL